LKFTKEQKTNSFLSASVELEGKLTVKGGIRIDGTLNGFLESESTIFLGDTAVINAQIVTKSLVSSGKIKGSIAAEDTVNINYPGSVEGEIKTCNLSIEKDVFFNAKCQLLSPQNNHLPKKKKPKFPRKAIPNRD